MIPLFSRQIPPFGTNTRIGDYDYSNEMKALGVNLDMLKERAEDVIKAYRHSLSTKSDGSSPFDPTVLLISAVVWCSLLPLPRLPTSWRSCRRSTAETSTRWRGSSTSSARWSGSQTLTPWVCTYSTKVCCD